MNQPYLRDRTSRFQRIVVVTKTHMRVAAENSAGPRKSAPSRVVTAVPERRSKRVPTISHSSQRRIVLPCVTPVFWRSGDRAGKKKITDGGLRHRRQRIGFDGYAVHIQKPSRSVPPHRDGVRREAGDTRGGKWRKRLGVEP